ncbi:hypothetical protein V8F06_005182 [Rhypophila decipiens]
MRHVLEVAPAGSSCRQQAAVPIGQEQAGNVLELDRGIDASLIGLCRDCISITDELLPILDSLKVGDDGRKWRSAQQALKARWKKEEVDALERRLDPIGKTLTTHIMMSQQEAIARKLHDLEDRSRRDNAQRTNEMESLKVQLRETFELLREDLQKGEQQQSNYAAEQIVLQQFRFPGIDDRYDGVHAAHDKTFAWVFAPTSTSEASCKASSNFTPFRNCGRAGNNPLITANFFFWSASKDHLPKSQEGLLCSLLYQIFRLSPETISSIYPEILRLQQQAQPSEERRMIFNHISHAVVPSTVPGLLTMLRQVCSSTTLVQTRLCFFIDGLDEYEGRPADIVDLIDIFRTLPNLKLCVSSRPWNKFEQAFGKNQSPKLYMHHINRDDIREYVHGIYSAMEATGMKGADLIEEIIDCSQGVFLWVYLVVRSFTEGLVNGDSIRDLQRRLRTLPVDLNEYFDKILQSDVDTVYRQESSRMFNAAVSAKGQLPFMEYWFIGPEIKKQDKSNAQTLQLQKRINARCKGLLEIKMHESRLLPGLLDPEVDFLHRTVMDFLVAPETQQTLASWDQGSYNMDSMICHALLAQLKTAPPICDDFQIVTFGSVDNLLNLFFSHCKALHDDPHHDYVS